MTEQEKAASFELAAAGDDAGDAFHHPQYSRSAHFCQSLAVWHLARAIAGAGDFDAGAIRRIWPDIPDAPTLWPSWIASHPGVAEGIARADPNGPPPEGNGTLGGWRVYTLADAYAPRPPVRYVVERLFSLPSLSIVYGPPGCFKTMLMGDMAGCVAGDLPWLPPLPGKSGETQRDTSEVPVLWLDFDNGVRTMHERLEAVGKARELPASAPLFYVSMPNPWLDASSFDSIAELEDRTRELGAKLIIIDNLRDVAGGVEENSAEMGDVMSNFRRLAEDTGSAVVLIHHQRKANGFKGRSGDTLRGHSSIEAALDLALLIEREEHANTIQIQASKVRGADILPFGAVFTFEWKPNTTELAKVKFFGAEVEDLTSDAAIRSVLLESVKANPGTNKGDLTTAVKQDLRDVGQNRIRTQIDRLAAEGKLTVTTGDRNAKTYTLPRVEDYQDVRLV